MPNEKRLKSHISKIDACERLMPTATAEERLWLARERLIARQQQDVVTYEETVAQAKLIAGKLMANIRKQANKTYIEIADQIGLTPEAVRWLVKQYYLNSGEIGYVGRSQAIK